MSKQFSIYWKIPGRHQKVLLRKAITVLDLFRALAEITVLGIQNLWNTVERLKSGLNSNLSTKER